VGALIDRRLVVLADLDGPKLRIDRDPAPDDPVPLDDGRVPLAVVPGRDDHADTVGVAGAAV